MLGRYAVLVLACLVLVGCQSDTPGLDFNRGVWGSQAINPPANLVRINRGDLIGRQVDAGSSSPLVVNYVLADPASGQPQYVAASGKGPGSYVVLPITALHIAQDRITVETTPRTLAQLPHMTASELEQRYPQTAVLVPIVPGAAPLASTLPPVAIPPAPQQLVLLRHGSVVGLPAVDHLGQPIGQVDAVATAPTTGEVRYAVISGPAFGLGNYIAVPSSNAQLSGGRVVVGTTLSSLTQMPRYRSEDLPQTLGALWTD